MFKQLLKSRALPYAALLTGVALATSGAYIKHRIDESRESRDVASSNFAGRVCSAYADSYERIFNAGMMYSSGMSREKLSRAVEVNHRDKNKTLLWELGKFFEDIGTFGIEESDFEDKNDKK